MSDNPHHREALIETAKLELDRAHFAATTMAGGEVRRGLTLALSAFREMVSLDEKDAASFKDIISGLEQAQADLDNGQLAEMERLIESARTKLNVD